MANPGAGPAQATANLATFLQQERSLLPRYEVGTISHFRFTTIQHHIDEAFNVVRQTKAAGDFERVAQEVRVDGAAIEQVTWRTFELCTREGSTGAWNTPAHLDEASSFSYHFCSEDSYEDFHWNYERVPRTALGDAFMLHTVNAHFEFDFLRSGRHGAIERLRKVGDSVIVPDSDRSFEIHLRAVPVTWTCTKRNFVSTFLGYGLSANRPTAVVAFSTWLDVRARGTSSAPAVERNGNTRFAGHLYVDIVDGSLIRGDFDEWVCLPIVTPESRDFIRLFVTYQIVRVV